MHRIDDATAVLGLFIEGNPGTGIPATKVRSAWLNDLQENLCHFIESMGITLSKGTYTQLTEAIAIARESATSEAVLGNNQTAAVIAGLTFDPATVARAVIEYDIYRKDDAPTEKSSWGTITLRWKPVLGQWVIDYDEKGDDVGVTFDFTVGGGNVAQVVYDSTNYAGANYVGEIRYKVKRFLQ